MGEPLHEKSEDRPTRYVQSFLHQRLAPTMRMDVYPAATWTGSRFGWDPPRVHEGLIVFPHCPEIIGRLTAKLFVDGVDEYLRAVIACVTLHVIHHTVPDDQRVAVVESALYDFSPGTVALLSRIELAALDAQ